MIFKNEDEKINRRSRIDEADSFWDVSDITPPKRNEARRTFKTDTEPVLVVDTAVDGQRAGEALIKGNASELLKEYSPSNPLINKVSVCTWPSKYTFYERFKLDAVKYFDIKHGETVPVKYFSYMPSYVQMSARQRDWYFYWRDCVRNKVYLPADSSYILLYIYEIINLPERISPENGIELICDIWKNYRESYTKLDKYLTEWLCDYCLVNGLAVPFERISCFYGKVLEESSFRQFYAKCTEEDKYAVMLMERLSSYRWTKSKYVTDQNRAVFEEHIRKGFAYAVKRLAASDGRFDEKSGRLTSRKLVRDAFSGALCAYNAKRKIEIEYLELGNVNDLSFIVTDMIRFCENRVRAYLGIRARLTVQNLTEQHKNILNEYFDDKLPCVVTETKKRSKRTEEEQAPEIKPFSVSFERAKAIERDSWQTTERLVEEDGEEGENEQDVEEKVVSAISPESESLEIARAALACVARGDNEGFVKLAEESYMMPDTLAECVNELCFEILGDIGIEECDGGYVLISDYEEEIRQWLNK